MKSVTAWTAPWMSGGISFLYNRRIRKIRLPGSPACFTSPISFSTARKSVLTGYRMPPTSTLFGSGSYNGFTGHQPTVGFSRNVQLLPSAATLA